MEQHKDTGSYMDIAHYRLKTAEEDLDAAKKLFQDNSIRIAKREDAEALLGTAEELISLIKIYVSERAQKPESNR